jgi:hypothetical protein
VQERSEYHRPHTGLHFRLPVFYSALMPEWKVIKHFAAPVPAWRAYEAQREAQLHAQLSAKAKNSVVTFDEDGRQRLPGRHSRIKRQIDVTVRGDFEGIGECTIIVDCKYFTKNKKINVCQVEQFIGLLNDVGVPLGLLVTTHGFTKAAKRRAEGERGVILEVIAFDELARWQLSKPSVALTHGASVGSVVYFNGKEFVTRLISNELAEKLTEKFQTVLR